ncbi:hypothetical protein, partial [Klebsiella pneumoniae]|uniref:hypothetical protein n=1 Tax=Klebsiella pneumoniae TaxID=573 RepID=UPI003EDF08C8
QIILCRRHLEGTEIKGLQSRLYFFEKVQKPESYSHLNALLSELNLTALPLKEKSWRELLGGILGTSLSDGRLPDLIWEKDCIKVCDHVVRTLSLT